jgi:hypothetical protein
MGGGRIPTFSLDELLPHISASTQTFEKLSVFKFKAHLWEWAIALHGRVLVPGWLQVTFASYGFMSE